MALDHLLAGLEREAAVQANALLAAARTEAARIAAEADARLARRRTVELGAEEAKLRGAAEAALGVARRSGRGDALEARARFLDRVFTAARALFPATLASDAYHAVLPDHLAEALRALGDEAATIHCPGKMASAVRAAIKGRQHLTVKGDPAARPGITVVTADGVIEVDNTLDGRLERLRQRLCIEVLARLETKAP
jgi:vacuolar-type H+-ATPase subunit E/Vma4